MGDFYKGISVFVGHSATTDWRCHRDIVHIFKFYSMRSRCSAEMDRQIELIFGTGTSFDPSYTPCYKETRVNPKMKVPYSEILSNLCGIRKYLHGTSQSLQVVVDLVRRSWTAPCDQLATGRTELTLAAVDVRPTASASLPHRASISAYVTMRVRQRVARVRLRQQLMLVWRRCCSGNESASSPVAATGWAGFRDEPSNELSRLSSYFIPPLPLQCYDDPGTRTHLPRSFAYSSNLTVDRYCEYLQGRHIHSDKNYKRTRISQLLLLSSWCSC